MTEPNERIRFRAVDFFLILLALFAVVGIVRRAGVFHANTTPAQTAYTVHAVWTDVDGGTAGCLQAGEWLYTNAGERFGAVTEVSSAPHETALWEEGKRFRATYPAGTREDVYLTVSVRGAEHEGVFLRENGRAVLVGETYRLYSSRASLTLTIRSIDVLE